MARQPKPDDAGTVQKAAALADRIGNPPDVDFTTPNVCKIGTAVDARGKSQPKRRKRDEDEDDAAE